MHTSAWQNRCSSKFAAAVVIIDIKIGSITYESYVQEKSGLERWIQSCGFETSTYEWFFTLSPSYLLSQFSLATIITA